MADDGASLLAAVERLAGFLLDPLTERIAQLERDLEGAPAQDRDGVHEVVEPRSEP